MPTPKIYEFSFISKYIENRGEYDDLKSFLEILLNKYEKILKNVDNYIKKKINKYYEFYRYINKFVNEDPYLSKTKSIGFSYSSGFNPSDMNVDKKKFIEIYQTNVFLIKFLLSRLDIEKGEQYYLNTNFEKLPDDMIGKIYENLDEKSRNVMKLTNRYFHEHFYKLADSYPLLDTIVEKSVEQFSYGYFLKKFAYHPIFTELIFLKNRENLIYYFENSNNEIIIYEDTVIILNNKKTLKILRYSDYLKFINDDFFIIGDRFYYIRRIDEEFKCYKYKYFDVVKYNNRGDETHYIIIMKKNNKYIDLYFIMYKYNLYTIKELSKVYDLEPIVGDRDNLDALFHLYKFVQLRPSEE